VAASQRQALVLASLIGRDGSTPSELAIPQNKAKEAVNVDFYRASFARKRNGCEDAFADTTAEAFTGQLSFLGRHVPGADETDAELWGIDNAVTPLVQRLTGGTVWSTVTLKDNWTPGNVQHIQAVPFNGKYFFCGDTAVNRLHVWDGSTLRRVGFATPAAATVANQGPGAYAAVLRYYKVLYYNSTDQRYSEASASVSFTPDGAHGDARITKPAAINEGETHWKIYASIDDALYFLLTTVAVGTTTYDDSTAYTTSVNPLSGNDAIPVVGSNVVPVSAKYILVDGNRLIFAGTWEGDDVNRIWFTPRLGSSDYADDERVPDTVDQSNWVDINEKDGDSITAMSGPIQGMPIVFKNRQTWKLRPTQDFDEPYAPMLISPKVGCLRQQASVMAEDENGDPALYFLSHRGPYRLGMGGIQYLGKDVEDLWERMNVDATTVSAFANWHEDKHQVWFHVALDDSNTPDHVLVFDTQLGEADEDDNVRGGWSTFDGVIAEARCGCVFSDTFGSDMSHVLTPYLGSNTVATLLRADRGTLDKGAAFAGYVQLPEKHLGALTQYCTVDQVIVVGSAGPHILQFDLTRDYGCEPRSATVHMSAETGDQTRAQRVFEAAFHADAKSIGMRVGDICPVGHPWTIDAIVIQHERKQEIAA
jgi:hypothetical protein